MAFDGLILKCVVNELQSINGYKIDKVYEPDKNTIIIGLHGFSNNINLLCCISSNNYRIHITNHNQQNPFVAPNFCMLLRKYLIGLSVKKIYSVDLERIVFIECENNDNENKLIKRKLIVELMGKHGNIILTDENNIIIDSIRHTSIEENSNRDIYPTSKYIFPESIKYSFLELKDFNDFYLKFESALTQYLSMNIQNIDNINNLDIFSFNIDKIISNTFNGISRSSVQNIIKNSKITHISKSNIKIIYTKIFEIINNKNSILCFTDDKKDFYLCNSSVPKKQFQINCFIDDFYFEKESNELFKNYRNGILNLILLTLKKYEKRLINIDNKLSECNNRDLYRLYGELIIANLYKIPNRNLENISLENYYDNNNLITIPLDKRYVPSYNAKIYFKKYSKLKSALETVTLQKQETIQEINYIESVIYELEACSSLEDVEQVYQEISENNIFSNKLKENKTKEVKKSKPLAKIKFSSFNPLKYSIGDYIILVGRNNVENDYLTCKYANKHDLWFHTKDIHGSHVILKSKSNESIPNEILLEAAKLAVMHSKAKNSSHVPVDYCKVSFVKKPNGSKPGYVIYSNNKTLYI